MPEPITILSSALCVATNAVTLGKQTYDIINSIRNAPDYITDLAADLHGLYVVLGTLQSALHVEDRKGAQSRFSVEAVENLKDFLENRMKCLNKTSKVVQPHLKANGGVVRSAWKGFKWDTIKKSDIAPGAPPKVQEKLHNEVTDKISKTMGYGKKDVEEALEAEEPSAIKDAYMIVRENKLMAVSRKSLSSWPEPAVGAARSV